MNCASQWLRSKKASMPNPPEKKCEFCDKRGLPLLLVRNAVAPSAGGAPLAASLPIELAASAAHYTTRLLRTGYLNVYDEARTRWESYFVTGEGYFFRLHDDDGVVDQVPLRFNCSTSGHREVASCITVSDPKNATKVWIGFSDVRWTRPVRKAHDDAAHRALHMVEIDVQALLAGGKAKHARPIAQLPAVVAEYAMDGQKAKTVFAWSPFNFDPRHGRAKRLIEECESMRPGKGVIVTVPDPAGIAQELAFLMKRNGDLFTSHPERRRNLAASTVIAQIEQGVRKKAVLVEDAAAEQLANQQMSNNPLGHIFSEKTRKDTENLRKVTPLEATSAADNEWKRYTKKFDVVARKKWQDDFNKELAAYDAKFIAPLARNHVAWMKSAALASYFECNYDRADPDSGVVYAAMLTKCVTATQDKRACAVLYDEWLEGSMEDRKNLLLQAMVLNQKSIADAVAKAVNVSIDPRQIPWDNLFATYGISLERLTVSAQNSIAELIVAFAGPFARMLSKILDGKYGARGALMGLGLISGHPIVRVELTGTVGKFRTLVAKELIKATGQSLSANQMKTAVGAELKLQGIQGVVMEGNSKKTFLVMVDKSITGMPDHFTTDKEKCEWVVKNIKTVEAVDNLNLGRWRTVINQNVRFGVVAGILQAVSLTKLIADEDKALASSKTDAQLRMYTGIATVAGTTAETIGSAVEGRALLRLGAGYTSNVATYLRVGGKGLGIAGGLVMAGLDVVQGNEAKAENQSGLAWLYYGSALVGALATGAIACAALLGAAAIPIIGVLILLLIGIGILIEYLKDNPVQDWLERCPWGILPAQRYKDLATEQAELEKAIKD